MTEQPKHQNSSETPPHERTLKRAISDADKDLRRNEILAAAKRVFSSKGFHSTTIADIAKDANLSYGSIYWYFDSKDALFHELMAVEEQALKDYIYAARKDATTRPDQSFQAAVQATFEFFEADKALVKLLFRDSYALGDRFEAHLFRIYEGFIGDIEAVVTHYQEKGEIIDAPPHLVAFSIAALITEFAHRRLETDDGLPASVVADFVIKLLLEGLLPRRKDRSGGQ